jgi:hypothetical protein
MLTPTLFKTLALRPPKAPNLPIAPVSYSQQYQDQLLNVLRLYFNEIDNFAQPLSSGIGGAFIQFPYGAFHYDKTTALTSGITNISTTPIPVTSTDGFSSSGAILIGTEIIKYTATTATTFAGTITRGAYGTSNSAHSTGAQVSSVLGTTAATATPMYLNTTDFDHGVTISNASLTSKITFQYAGVYNVQFSAQLSNSASADDNVTIWLRQNGVDVPASAGISSVPGKHGSTSGAIISAWNVFISANANDYIELYWATDGGTSVVATYPASTTAPVHPISPALIVTVSFVSSLY